MAIARGNGAETATAVRGTAAPATAGPVPQSPWHLVIACPETGLLTETGFDSWHPPTARRNRLVDCLECGQDHDWRLGEAVWQPTQAISIPSIGQQSE